MTQPEIKVVPDAAAIAREAAARIVVACGESIADGGTFSLALSGGHTPETLYRLLATDEYRARIDWSRVHVYFGDERCVRPDHADSNYRMAAESLLSHVPIPADNVYRMRGEIDPSVAASEYDALLNERFADRGLDVVLLGMGDDGHTASLFPGTAALHEARRLCVANDVQRMGVWRITMTVPFINRSRSVIIMTNGASKAARLAEVLQGPKDPDRLPIQRIDPEQGTLTWVIDVEAAGMGQF